MGTSDPDRENLEGQRKLEAARVRHGQPAKQGPPKQSGPFDQIERLKDQAPSNRPAGGGHVSGQDNQAPNLALRGGGPPGARASEKPAASSFHPEEATAHLTDEDLQSMAECFQRGGPSREVWGELHFVIGLVEKLSGQYLGDLATCAALGSLGCTLADIKTMYIQPAGDTAAYPRQGPIRLTGETLRHELEALALGFNRAGLQERKDDPVPHPVAVLVYEWNEWKKRRPAPQPRKPSLRPDRKPKAFRPRSGCVPRLERINPDEAEKLGDLPDCSGVAERGQRWLPTLEPEVLGCPSWLVHVFQQAVGRPLGGRAAREMVLFVGAMVHLKMKQRDGCFHPVSVPTSEVVTWLHPDGWANRRRDWKQLPAAFEALNNRLARVYLPGVGSVGLMWAQVYPKQQGDEWAVFQVRVSPSAARGWRIDWPKLCRHGAESDRKFRAHLSAAAFLDRSARRGRPVLRVQETDRQYVRRLCAGDLARMIGLDGEQRKYRTRAVETFEELASDGVIDLQRDGSGFLIFGPVPAIEGAPVGR